MRKYLPYICLIIIFIVVLISILFNKSKGVEQFIYYYDSYNLTSTINDDDYLNINIYVNSKTSYFIDKSQLSDCYLKNEENIIDLELISIHNANEVVKYKEEDYYNFIFKFKLKFDTTTNLTWHMKKTTLHMRYNNSKEYNLDIGDLTINKIINNKELISLTNIKPLTSIIKNNTYLTGVVIGIRNVTKNNLKINKISLLDANVSVGNQVYILNELPESNSFDSVADFDYLSVSKGIEEVNINLKNETIFIFIPIYYNKLTLKTKFPIEFTLNTTDFNQEKYILFNYTFFEPSNYIVDENELIICEIK